MLWAFSTIRLRFACRKICFRQTVDTAPERITSPRMLPGPTLGSWSASPTMMTRQLGRRAASRLWNSWTSTMLISSRITTSHLSRLRSLWMKLTRPPV